MGIWSNCPSKGWKPVGVGRSIFKPPDVPATLSLGQKPQIGRHHYPEILMASLASRCTLVSISNSCWPCSIPLSPAIRATSWDNLNQPQLIKHNWRTSLRVWTLTPPREVYDLFGHQEFRGFHWVSPISIKTIYKETKTKNTYIQTLQKRKRKLTALK